MSTAQVTIRVEADDTSASCDGGGGALGHPLIYLPFDGRDHVDCYYCSRRFAKPRWFEREQQVNKQKAAG